LVIGSTSVLVVAMVSLFELALHLRVGA
jgi:hypothetical protein